MTSEYLIFDIVVESSLQRVLDWLEASIFGLTTLNISIEKEECRVDIVFTKPNKDRGDIYHNLYFMGIPEPSTKSISVKADGSMECCVGANDSDEREILFLGYLQIRPLADQRVQILGNREENAIVENLKRIGEKIATIYQCHNVYNVGREPPAPEKPPLNSSIEDFLAYYHACKRAKIPCFLRELVNISPFSYDTIRKHHIGCSICHPEKNIP